VCVPQFAAMFRGLARGGTRGGKDQFSWEDVKNDKDRENYIGHSLKASVGRWQKNRDIFWYTRGKNSDEAGREEVELMKKLEQRKMDEALGLVGPSENEEDEPINTLETHEMQVVWRLDAFHVLIIVFDELEREIWTYAAGAVPAGPY